LSFCQHSGNSGLPSANPQDFFFLNQERYDQEISPANGNKCKFLLTSLNNTQVIEKDNKFKKDKRSEDVSSGVLPEEATHFGDAADKKIWIKYGSRLQRFSGFIPARI